MIFLNTIIRTTGSGILMLILSLSLAFGSSHREAPLIANDPLADNTDLYAFRSPDAPNTVTIIANYVPLQLPYGGPNYYQFGEDVRYEIHIDNDVSTAGDDIIYRFTFTKTNQDPTTFFNIRLGAENLKTTYTMERSTDGGATFTTVVSNGVVPPYNIGERSIESPVGLASDYESLFTQAITTTSDGEKVFCGPVDDPFFVDLGGIFDLGDAPRQSGMPKDGVSCMNVSSIAIQVPISMLQKNGQDVSMASDILDGDYVIGVWASASRKQVRTLSSTGNPTTSGSWVQVSRLGMPLTNEAVIPIGAKDEWNSRTPYNENPAHFEYFYNPELGLYMDDALFGTAVPALSPLRIQRNSLGAFDFGNGNDGLYGLKGSAAVSGTALDDAVFGTLLLPAPGKPRSVDLWPAFHTGVPNVRPYQLATGKNGDPLASGKPFVNNFLPNGGDMLRLNMATPATDRSSADFSSLGLVQAAVLGLTNPTYASNANLEWIPNMDGFPNGRRLEDDVTRIELQAVSGIVLAAIGLWYDDFDPATSSSPVTQDLLDVLTYSTGVEENDTTFRSAFPYVQLPWSGTGKCGGEPVAYTQPAVLAPTQSVGSFTLVNADNDQDIMALGDGDTIDLSVYTSALNIRANTYPVSVGSVVLNFTGNPSMKNENFAPYALGGDSNGDYNALNIMPGVYTLTATPYSQTNGNGNMGVPFTITFTVINGQNIAGFTLYNAKTDMPVGPLMDGDVIDLSVIGTDRLNITAETDPATVGSVKFGFNGNANYKVENQAPYALGGNIGANFNSIIFTPGTYTVSATPYSESKANGEMGMTQTITFSVINSGNGSRLENNIASLSVYPNPVKEDLVLEMEKGQKGQVNIKLMNMFGQTVMERSLEVNSGKWTYKLPVAKLPAGVYTVTVQSENSFVSRQIIKE